MQFQGPWSQLIQDPWTSLALSTPNRERIQRKVECKLQLVAEVLALIADLHNQGACGGIFMAGSAMHQEKVGWVVDYSCILPGEREEAAPLLITGQS